MKSLRRAARSQYAGGELMPSVFPQLSAKGADARRGEILMIIGQPSSGKSSIALWHAVVWTWTYGLRGLYFSADTTAKPAGGRVASMILGDLSSTDAQALIEESDGRILSALDEVSHMGLEWAFDPDISSSNLELNLTAFEEKWGKLPDYFVIDNLSDVDTADGDSEGGILRRTVRDVNHVARITNAAAVVLHHTSEGEKEEPVPPRKATMFKVFVKPTIGLSTARSEGNIKHIGIVKNRYDPSAEDRFGHVTEQIPFDARTLRFGNAPLTRRQT